MSHADRPAVGALAARQLPFAALYGIGHELDELADALTCGELVIHLGTATVEGTFGVLALTDDRLLWVSAGPGRRPVSVWPLEALQVRTTDGNRLVQAYGAPLCELGSILPDGAADDLVTRLIDSASKQPA